MGCLKISQENYADVTVVSNRFIDNYMSKANDAQLKIYLYLLRMLNSGHAFGISDIADAFNHTEKDVMRALRYWESLGVLALDYEGEQLSGVRLLELSGNAEDPVPASRHQPADGAGASDRTAPQEKPTVTFSAAKAAAGEPVSETFSKPAYTLDELKAFREKDSAAQLFFIAEQYLGRTLSASDMKSILFFSDRLHFSDDLIDYLLQYCVERGKKVFRYIEKVAVSWAEAHVTTPAEAESQSGRYDRAVYTVMNALGKSGVPTRKEAEFIRRWREDYAFEISIIVEACERTVLATDKHRFEYADRILASWKEAGVHHQSDIDRLDKGFQKERPARQGFVRSTDKYNRFMQNNYDYDALEKELLHN